MKESTHGMFELFISAYLIIANERLEKLTPVKLMSHEVNAVREQDVLTPIKLTRFTT